ncbi:putative acetylcholinesterase precursor [Diaporthe ampelina]|uniref:Putative acetylcholinesterase n=1 Tax=Diaporthe ampelina TaxID=1214573 RepID=A0A0G2I454_9PEZI|nr:putative acetylcholinesterase precursor [Diaporthe ampelina]
MTAAAPKAGPSVDSDSDSDQAQPPHESWPLPGPGPRAGSTDDGDHARQHDTAELGRQREPEPDPEAEAEAEAESKPGGLGQGQGQGQGKRPWWRRRIAIWSFAAAAVLLVAFVVLLTLGLLGYLKAAATPIPTNLGTLNIPGQDPQVNLGYATYVGTKLDGGVNRFLGMRYAAPPVGDLRWRAPVAPPTSTTPQSAKAFGPICLGISVTYPVSYEDEDCLYANVWAPQDANTTSNLPVWLFIQGGGYVSNSNANWDGDEVVRQSGNKIVFVNFNYRVSMWGFLASSRVQADGSLNAGLLDQRFVMEWVRSNIASFGGDPDNVVIHGASAGAGSVALHLMAFGGRNDGLFSAGIAESVFFPAQPFVDQLEYQFDRLANATGCAARPDQLACLRALDTKTLQAQNVPSVFPGRTDPPLPLFYWTPCIDGDFLQDLPYNLLAQGRFLDLPLLFGNDNDEGSYFATNAATPEEMAQFFQNNYPLLTADDAAAIERTYPLMPALPQHNAWFPSASMAYGEATFVCPAISLFSAYTQAASSRGGGGTSTSTNTTAAATAAAAAAAPPLWLYRYNVVDNDNAAAGVGVPHLWESYAVFGPTNLASNDVPDSYLTYNAPIVPVVMSYFLSFVQTRDPNPLRAPGSPVWESWSAPGAGSNGSRIVLETNNVRMEPVEDDQAARCQFWAGLAPRTQQKVRRGREGAGPLDLPPRRAPDPGRTRKRILY